MCVCARSFHKVLLFTVLGLLLLLFFVAAVDAATTITTAATYAIIVIVIAIITVIVIMVMIVFGGWCRCGFFFGTTTDRVGPGGEKKTPECSGSLSKDKTTLHSGYTAPVEKKEKKKRGKGKNTREHMVVWSFGFLSQVQMVQCEG